MATEFRKVASLTGYEDEIYDVTHTHIHGKDYLAVASNTCELRIYNLASRECVTLKGHAESILSVDFAVDWDPCLIATGSKDNSIRLWRFDPLQMERTHAIAEGTGHTNSVSGVRFSHQSLPKSPSLGRGASKQRAMPFLISVSSDTTIKAWSMESFADAKAIEDGGGREGDKTMLPKLKASSTLVAHSKEINSVDVSRNSRLCVTASMDKTVELFHIDSSHPSSTTSMTTLSLTPAGSLGGHKRGVWCARFSPDEQLVATCSGDCTVRVYSLLDNSCIHTLSDHSFAVLSVLFIDNSQSLLSADGGGLIKIWKLPKGRTTARHPTCAKTIEAHEEKIWALTAIDGVKPPGGGENLPTTDSRYASVGADGQVAVWQDVSEEVRAEQERQRVELVAQEQTLENLRQQGRWVEALRLALDLDRPYNALTILQAIFESPEDGEDMKRDAMLDQMFGAGGELTPAQLSTLLDYVAKWNVNTKTYHISQQILYRLFHHYTPDELIKLPNMAETIRALLPYTQRHYERLTNARANSTHMKYVFSRMRKLE